MSTSPASLLLPSPQNRRAAAEQFSFANQWLVAHRPEKAVPFLLHCCRLDPSNLIYRQSLRDAQHGLSPKTGLFARIRKWSTLQRLKHSLHAKNWPNVLEAAEAVLCLDASNATAHLALTDAFEAMGLLEQALWCLEQMEVGGNTGEVIKAKLVGLYERAGRFSRAKEVTSAPKLLDAEAETQARLLREQIAVTPTSAQLYVQLIHVYRAAGDQDAARAWLLRGLTATVNDFELALEQAQMDLTTLREDAAIAEQRLANDPTSQELTALLDRARHEIQCRTIDLCRQRADRYASEKRWRLELGVELLKAGQFDAALEAFAEARSDDKLAWRALVYAGYCHVNRKQMRKAAPFFEEALPLIPPEAEATRKEVEALLAQWRA
ncbi:MAG TPA: tetratricopeptide repeat protein [Gemmataceae bacterium]|nr:tetratricopeptide repeat protein [Gemmataceae bacterium]